MPKLHALGVGWTHTSSPMTAPSAIAFNVPFAFGLTPMRLPPDSGFVWVLKVNDREWRASFVTRPVQ